MLIKSFPRTLTVQILCPLNQEEEPKKENFKVFLAQQEEIFQPLAQFQWQGNFAFILILLYAQLILFASSFSCIGTNAGFYADLETNCQVIVKFNSLNFFLHLWYVIILISCKPECNGIFLRFTTTVILMGAKTAFFVPMELFSIRR